MPVFEYRCSGCGRKFSALVGMVADDGPVACPGCGSFDVAKLVSRVGKFRVEDDRLAEVAEGLESLGDDVSAGTMRDRIRDVGKAMDEDLSGVMEEMFDADMAGELPEDV